MKYHAVVTPIQIAAAQPVSGKAMNIHSIDGKYFFGYALARYIV